MKNLLFIPLCCCARLVLGGKPSSLRFQRAVIDDNPPHNPWIKIVGDFEGDGKPDLVIGGRTVAELVTTERPPAKWKAGQNSSEQRVTRS